MFIYVKHFSFLVNFYQLLIKCPFNLFCCSVAKLGLTLCNSMDRSTPGLSVLHHLPVFDQTHVHWVGDAIQPCHSLSYLSPPAFNLSHPQSLSNESAFHIGWPNYWSFSTSPSNEHPAGSLVRSEMEEKELSESSSGFLESNSCWVSTPRCLLEKCSWEPGDTAVSYLFLMLPEKQEGKIRK